MHNEMSKVHPKCGHPLYLRYHVKSQ